MSCRYNIWNLWIIVPGLVNGKDDTDLLFVVCSTVSAVKRFLGKMVRTDHRRRICGQRRSYRGMFHPKTSPIATMRMNDNLRVGSEVASSNRH